MRISDWSSDVCSSDLLAGFDLCVGAAASRYSQGDAKKHGSRRKHSENKGVSHRSSFGSTCRPLARKRDYARPSPERMLATRREYREGIRFFSSRKFPRLIDKPAKAAEEVARSEEHTSELQSLMRISYAVFCLKTKISEIHK